MKKLILLLASSVLVLSALSVICAVADCQICRGMPEDCSDLPDGRVFLQGEPPYPYIPTETPKSPPMIPPPPEGPTD